MADKELIKKCIADNGLQVGGIALRYNKDFIDGEFTNPNPALRSKAIETTLEAAEMCKFLEGNTVTLWFGYDGYDYPFQQDYFRAYELLVDALRIVTRHMGICSSALNTNLMSRVLSPLLGMFPQP